MFQRILVPLDRSPLAEQAIPQAAAIARACGANIDIVLVHVPAPFAGYRVRGTPADDWNHDHEYVENIVKEVSKGANLSATHTVLRGEPAEMICHRAHDAQADLIVMTSHGRTGLSRAWLGSVADAVIRHASTPVLMLRPVETKRAYSAAHHLFAKVLVPLDATTPADELITAACEVAKCSGARVTLLHVIQPVPLVVPDAGVAVMYPPPLVDDAAVALIVDEAKQRLDSIAVSLEKQHRVAVDTRVVVDASVAKAILDFAHDDGTDLIAMPTHGRGTSRLLLGSIADKVLRASGLPMLLFRPAFVEAEHGAVRAAETPAPAFTPA